MQWATSSHYEANRVPVQAHQPDSPQKGEGRDHMDKSSNEAAGIPNNESETTGHEDSFQVTRQ